METERLKAYQSEFKNESNNKGFYKSFKNYLEDSNADFIWASAVLDVIKGWFSERELLELRGYFPCTILACLGSEGLSEYTEFFYIDEDMIKGIMPTITLTFPAKKKTPISIPLTPLLYK
jgi:hypothetical protein